MLQLHFVRGLLVLLLIVILHPGAEANTDICGQTAQEHRGLVVLTVLDQRQHQTINFIQNLLETNSELLEVEIRDARFLLFFLHGLGDNIFLIFIFLPLSFLHGGNRQMGFYNNKVQGFSKNDLNPGLYIDY